MIIKHLPLDMFGRKKKVKNVIDYVESISNLKDSSIINSIYLDNEKLTMYHKRLPCCKNYKKGNLIRIRWYGEYANPPDKIYIERKTRLVESNQNTILIDHAIKERFIIKEVNILPFLKGFQLSYIFSIIY
jgi:SPX domain protein involved in polyphosphate accumulation